MVQCSKAGVGFFLLGLFFGLMRRAHRSPPVPLQYMMRTVLVLFIFAPFCARTVLVLFIFAHLVQGRSSYLSSLPHLARGLSSFYLSLPIWREDGPCFIYLCPFGARTVLVLFISGPFGPPHSTHVSGDLEIMIAALIQSDVTSYFCSCPQNGLTFWWNESCCALCSTSAIESVFHSMTTRYQRRTFQII